MWAILLLIPGFMALMALLIWPIVYFRFFRPANNRKLNVLSDAKAKIRNGNKKLTMVKFGDFKNARQWPFPSDQVDRLQDGGLYDVYWIGDALVFLEPADPARPATP